MNVPEAKPTILLLGTVHLAGGQQDVFQSPADAVESARRQREVRECVECLKRFGPTKVALEVDAARDDELNERYGRYRAGMLALAWEEVQQFGFRIAAECGHERVYAVDWNAGRGDLGLSIAFAKVHQPELYRRLFPAKSPTTGQAQPTVRVATLREQLRQLNTTSSLQQSHAMYLTTARIGRGHQYIGVDWVKGWYERNLIIFVNLTRIPVTPDDRLLVIYGAGHIPLLTQFVRDCGLFRLATVDSYL